MKDQIFQFFLRFVPYELILNCVDVSGMASIRKDTRLRFVFSLKMWVHAWIVILCKHLSDGGWYSHYLILLKKKCQNHGQNLHSSCKVNFRFEPKIDLLPNDLMIHHENSRRHVSGSIHLLYKPFLDVLLDYYDMNVWRIPKQILDGKVEYHNIILFFRKLNFSQILAHTIYADFQYIYSRASNWTQDSQCTNLGRGKFEAWI